MNKHSCMLVIAMATSVLATGASNAFACGESLFHSGEGMRYHGFLTRAPANILIYRPGMSSDNVAQRDLDTGLAKAGHRVTLVTSNAELAQALEKDHYDVVIADAHDMEMLASRLDSSAHAPALVAVVSAKANQGATTRGKFTQTLNEQDGLNQYLRLIEKTMQTRRT